MNELKGVKAATAEINGCHFVRRTEHGLQSVKIMERIMRSLILGKNEKKKIKYYAHGTRFFIQSYRMWNFTV